MHAQEHTLQGEKEGYVRGDSPLTYPLIISLFFPRHRGGVRESSRSFRPRSFCGAISKGVNYLSAFIGFPDSLSGDPSRIRIQFGLDNWQLGKAIPSRQAKFSLPDTSRMSTFKKLPRSRSCQGFEIATTVESLAPTWNLQKQSQALSSSTELFDRL